MRNVMVIYWNFKVLFLQLILEENNIFSKSCNLQSMWASGRCLQIVVICWMFSSLAFTYSLFYNFDECILNIFRSQLTFIEFIAGCYIKVNFKLEFFSIDVDQRISSTLWLLLKFLPWGRYKNCLSILLWYQWQIKVYFHKSSLWITQWIY